MKYQALFLLADEMPSLIFSQKNIKKKKKKIKMSAAVVISTGRVKGFHMKFVRDFVILHGHLELFSYVPEGRK